MSLPQLTPEMARKLAVAEAQHSVARVSGELGQARKQGREDDIPGIQERLTEARTRLVLAKVAAA